MEPRGTGGAGAVVADAGHGPRVAVVTVGDEILLGEIDNGNARLMLQLLQRHGELTSVALSLPDDPAMIAAWIRWLRASGCGTIWIAGGIGGTHDDRTREGVAAGLGRALCRHDRCFAILAAKYGDRFNEQRQRMAWLPEGSDLIDNPLGAPGFSVDEVHAFPGFPSMLEPMMEAVLTRRAGSGGAPCWVTRQVVLPCAEGEIAGEVEAFASRLGAGKLGIYPSSERFGREVTLRLRCPQTAEETLDGFDELVGRLRARC